MFGESCTERKKLAKYDIIEYDGIFNWLQQLIFDYVSLSKSYTNITDKLKQLKIGCCNKKLGCCRQLKNARPYFTV